MLRNDLYVPWFKDQGWGFEIIDGEYSGVVTHVTKLEIRDPTPEDSSNLTVDYVVIHKPETLTDEQIKNQLFESLFQTIITDIVKEAVENYEHENNGNNNTKESDSQ